MFYPCQPLGDIDGFVEITAAELYGCLHVPDVQPASAEDGLQASSAPAFDFIPDIPPALGGDEDDAEAAEGDSSLSVADEGASLRSSDAEYRQSQASYASSDHYMSSDGGESSFSELDGASVLRSSGASRFSQSQLSDSVLELSFA